MARSQDKLPDTDDGHLQRLHRAQERSAAVLSCAAAQDTLAPKLGTEFKVVLAPMTGQAEFAFDVIEPELLAYAATLARPFTLKREAIYGPSVAKSLLRFASTERQRDMSTQVCRMWEELPLRRMQTFSSTMPNPQEGVWDWQVADRVLYSEVVHADDASEILDHVPAGIKQWAFAGFVGDWFAVIAHQQAILNWVRPDICSELTPWGGCQTTIFDRLGVTPEPP
ncbi:MAG: hypothetical protein ACRC0L_05670 [Angustibacter sp.]